MNEQTMKNVKKIDELMGELKNIIRAWEDWDFEAMSDEDINYEAGKLITRITITVMELKK